jgi:hypothetical protein
MAKTSSGSTRASASATSSVSSVSKGTGVGTGWRGGASEGDTGILDRVAGDIGAFLTTAEETGSGGRTPTPSGGVRGAPGPVAGAGLPFLILFGGIAYLVVRRKAAAVCDSGG